MISVGGMAQLGEWSRLINQGQLFFYAWEEYSRWPMVDVLLSEGRCSYRSPDVSGRMVDDIVFAG
jgi:hypothetical protein